MVIDRKVVHLFQYEHEPPLDEEDQEENHITDEEDIDNLDWDREK